MKITHDIISILLMISTLFSVPSIADSKNMNGHSVMNKSDKYFTKSKALCFTRFTIDIPKNSQTVYGRLSAGAELTRIEGGANKIDEIIKFDIKNSQKDAELFKKYNKITEITEKIISTDNPDIKQLITLNGIDTYILRSYLKLAQDVYISTGSSIIGHDVREYFLSDIEVFKHLRARKDDEIPTEPGICIDGAFSTLETPYESIEFGVRLTDFPDVHFSFQSIKSGNLGMELELKKDLEEGKQNARATGLGAWVKKLKVLRLGKRTVNDWHGEEMLLHVPSGNGKPSYHKFVFRALCIEDDPLHPYVEMTLDTGVVENQSASKEPSLSDEEALALWDKLLNSIRVRPNAVATGSLKSVQTEDERRTH
ncbi:T6SS immunity protein Tli4 family protein [Pseudoduganella danionis]|uniref:Tle cognate immunity protein 4 C-terminal domain-containing protein n=1 Tax=Pseudoduganella danionis TaxID=1890295 RepID=A0ABW9SQE4_9BURK|nr:T6SS immunity protein Tli4 family protein [Pseudoduganella danionis]MTW34306.1 hypothetical protein [Pseudoduganella danionis]